MTEIIPDRNDDRNFSLADYAGQDGADTTPGTSEFDDLLREYDGFFNDAFAPEPQHLESDDFSLPFDVADIDLTRPPGFVGKVADWIDSQCRYPRRRLAVASAITAIGNIGGLSHRDTHDGITANMLAFCVAASSTGKEAVMQAFGDIHQAAGLQRAIHGSFKSEQEVVRNLVEHQAAFYNVDEMGIFLTKVRNAQKRGGASYLEGIFGIIMSAYSKANSRFLLSGDIKRDLRKMYSGLLSKAQDDADDTRIASAERMLAMVDSGLERPFLSIIGFTTPSTFDSAMDGETATQGFAGRAIIINERDINPKPRHDFSKPEMPIMMGGKLGLIYGGDRHGRIEHIGDRVDVHTTDEAKEALARIIDWTVEYADQMNEANGEAAVAMVRRSYELIAKVSFILAIPDKQRTLEHVRWAFAYIKDELDFKLQLVFANDNAKTKPEDALAARLLNFIDAENGASTAVLANRTRLDKPTIETTMKHLQERGLVLCRPGKQKRKGKQVDNWFRVAGV